MHQTLMEAEDSEEKDNDEEVEFTGCYLKAVTGVQ